MLNTDDVTKLTTVLKEHFYDKAQIDGRFDKIEQKIDKLLTAVDNLTHTVKGFQEEMIANRNRIDKLEAWAKMVSDKVGIPLPH
ncbi:MAG: hypothetical protein COT92_00175 [Candidatus Doudnabacteria bacterium CG10_big_fil_rev_8_21_14_0_10_42_18]|uniref:Uncharacterized protein n=1 Tax=Candidatus Doudnabacteria bacterium CG10_big_fil_rev_8_21_14_0_10_42_18 TaxID=1974552 RepID=A0A2H0VBY4_9BACT|nr:MAG: hypothetical protein COT92_00175 [Candidatus Doudnabacteria bacterium CG10_big_fil_rev_8_21_14_0_10_42_18]